MRKTDGSKGFQWACLALSALVLMGVLPAVAGQDTGTPEKAADKFDQFMGWGLRSEAMLPAAAQIGVTDVFVGFSTPERMLAWVKAGASNGIGVYAVVTLDPHGWTARFPGVPVPLQKMSDEEHQALARLRQSTNAAPYQWGGEPLREPEVLTHDMLCFHHAAVVTLLKERIRAMAAVPGLRGVAFDGVGYQNYRCCLCDESRRQFAEYQATHREVPADKALIDFSLETLVAFNNDLVGFARSLRPDLMTANHIWPVFSPEPLYGNRLDIDLCGQTAAWYFDWDLAKVQRYAHVIASREQAHYPRSRGVAMIGFYDNPRFFPVKTSDRVDAELRAILAGGCRRVMVCGLDDVLKTPGVAAVFRKHTKR